MSRDLPDAVQRAVYDAACAMMEAMDGEHSLRCVYGRTGSDPNDCTCSIRFGIEDACDAFEKDLKELKGGDE